MRKIWRFAESDVLLGGTRLRRVSCESRIYLGTITANGSRVKDENRKYCSLLCRSFPGSFKLGLLPG
jgi:hypothetical protein